MTSVFKKLQLMLAIVAGIALFAMMVLTFVDVVGRYGFNRSIFGTAELIEYLMVVVVFAGVAFVSSSNRHIRVELFEPVLKRYVPNLQRWAILAFSLMVYACLTWELGKNAIASLGSGKTTAVLDLPQWFLPAFAAGFSAAGVILFVLAVILTGGHPEELDEDFDERRHDDPAGL